MTSQLDIEAEWEILKSGVPEERACFAAIGIRFGDLWLTEVSDHRAKRTRTHPFLSAYRLAEWLGWNWWKLRWEPKRRTADWNLAHRMASIGGGYVWPNITIRSDGERVVLNAKPTASTPAEPIRYIANAAVVVRAVDFEGAVDRFMEQVCAQLQAEGIPDSNVNRIWQETLEERSDPEKVIWRKLEAILGFDPDDADPGVIKSFLDNAASFGERAVTELAADVPANTTTVSPSGIYDIAQTAGYEWREADAVRLRPKTRLPAIGAEPAWRRGIDSARALREQQRLGNGCIDNRRLAALAGVSQAVIDDGRRGPAFCFALKTQPNNGKIVLRARHGTGRRFELARLIGDQVAGGGGGEALHPVTSSYTYRQQYQRSFAAEFLCPLNALEEMLGGDRSAEAIEDAAHAFNVSEWTIRTKLVNHGLLDRGQLEEELYSDAV